MSDLQQLTLDAAEIATRLSDCSDSQLDELAFGVVEMDHEGTVLRYNAVESHFSGLAPGRVLGRHFFREVAPCSNNRHVAQRYAEASLDETIDYTFALRMKPVPVTLRMVKPAGGDRMYLLVRWV